MSGSGSGILLLINGPIPRGDDRRENNDQAEKVQERADLLIPAQQPDMREKKVPVVDDILSSAHGYKRQCHGLRVLHVHG